jgi:hypothetical protein
MFYYNASAPLTTTTTMTTATKATAAPTGSQNATTTTSSLTSATPGLPGNFSYYGCWIDGANGRILANQQPDNSTLTVESCISTCVSLGYSIAGMEYGVQVSKDIKL